MGDTDISEPVATERISRLTLDYSSFRSHLVEPREISNVEEAEEIIDRLYASGMPFFTKTALQYVWEEIKRNPARGEEIILKDITGAAVACTVATGKIRPWVEDDETRLEYVCKEMVLAYKCRASLKNELSYLFAPHSWKPCPVRIMHGVHEWDSKTETVIPRRPPLNRGEVESTFRDKTDEWMESPACTRLKSILSSAVMDHKIDKVVGFALGTMSDQMFNDDGSLDTEFGWRAASQHALLLTLKNWLQERHHREEVVCYTQDPSLSEVDEHILDEVGIEVIEDPRGWLEVDEYSMILSVSPNVPSKEIITDIARPAVIIWDRVGFDDGLGEGRTDPDSPRIRAMLEGYELHEFSPDKELFSDIVLYIRKSVVAPTCSEDGIFS